MKKKFGLFTETILDQDKKNLDLLKTLPIFLLFSIYGRATKQHSLKKLTSRIIFTFNRFQFCFLFSSPWEEHKKLQKKMESFRSGIHVVVLIFLMCLPHSVVPYFQYPSVYWAPKNCRYAMVEITDV